MFVLHLVCREKSTTTMDAVSSNLVLCAILLLVIHSTDSTRVPCRTPGFFLSPDRTRCLHVSSDKHNFAASSVFCQAYNATLITMDNEYKQNQAEQFIQDSYGTYYDGVYIGAVNILSDRSWTWYQRGKMNSTNWDAEEPKIKTGYACALMRLGYPDYKWQTTNCLRENRYMCEQKSSTEDTIS